MDDDKVLAVMNQVLEGMNSGFNLVHGKLDGFKKEFTDHQLACAKLFAKMQEGAAVKEAIEEVKAKNELEENRKGVDWGKVKTMAIGVIFTALFLLLLGVLFPNIKWRG